MKNPAFENYRTDNYCDKNRSGKCTLQYIAHSSLPSAIISFARSSSSVATYNSIEPKTV